MKKKLEDDITRRSVYADDSKDGGTEDCIEQDELEAQEDAEEEDEDYEERRERRGSGFFWKLMLMFAMAVFLFSAYQLYSIFNEYKEGVEQYGDISDLVVQKPSTAPTPIEENEALKPSVTPDANGDAEVTEEPTPEQKEEYIPPEVDFEELKRINGDVVGWIEVEAMPNISYPIVRADDNDYYLKRTIYGKTNSAGSIFMDYRNKGDFSDCNTVIYGHNMKNGSMFGYLSLLCDQDKYKNSKYIWICTPEAKYRYEIFSMQYANIYSSTYTYHQKPGKEFQQYLIEMAMKSEIDMKASYLTENDKIITLSTCTGNDKTRFVVQARWVATY